MGNEQMRPASNEQAPDPSNSYERDHPKRESATGQTDAPKPPQHETPDKMGQAVPNRQPPRQINAEDSQSGQAALKNTPQADQSQPDHSMNDEPETGWDSAPTDIKNPREKRHPHTGGKGGTPDVGEKPERS